MSVPVSLEDVLQPTQTFPVDVEIVEGFESHGDSHSEWLPLLCSGSRIRILLAATEPVFRCQTEPDHRTLSLSVGCSTRLEILQPDAVIDDQTFETVGDILRSPVLPFRVLVQSGYDGGATINTIDVGEVLEGIRSRTNDKGVTTLRATSISQTSHQELLGRPVALSLDTVGTFTTTAAQNDRYLAIELAKKWTRVPQRVRVHTDTCEPFKACIRKLEEQKVAACIHLKSGQYVVIPASSEIRVRVLKEYPISSSLSKNLQKWVNITTLPRIELNSIKGQSHSNDTVNQLAVLFSPTLGRSLNTDYLCHYETLVDYPVMHQVNNGPIRQTGPLPQSNLLSSHRNICTKISQTRLLLEISTMTRSDGGDDDDDDDDDDDAYELPGYVPVGRKHQQPAVSKPVTMPLEDHYAGLQTRHSVDDVYSLTGHYTKLIPSRIQTDMPYAEVGKPLQEKFLRTKLDGVREHNWALQHYKSFIQDTLDCLPAWNTESVKDLMCSLSCKETVSLLENAGLGMYKQRFIDEKVEGCLIHGGGKDYLLDMGMRPAHACKFMAILKGRVPPWTVVKLLVREHLIDP